MSKWDDNAVFKPRQAKGGLLGLYRVKEYVVEGKNKVAPDEGLGLAANASASSRAMSGGNARK
jgi:hypothetical protein